MSVINPNGVLHRQNPLVFFVTFVVHFRGFRPLPYFMFQLP